MRESQPSPALTQVACRRSADSACRGRRSPGGRRSECLMVVANLLDFAVRELDDLGADRFELSMARARAGEL